jgi:hypothetical protein
LVGAVSRAGSARADSHSGDFELGGTQFDDVGRAANRFVGGNGLVGGERIERQRGGGPDGRRLLQKPASANLRGVHRILSVFLVFLIGGGVLGS